MKKNLSSISIFLLFLTLSIIYCAPMFLSPSNHIVGCFFSSDIFSNVMEVQRKIRYISQGFLPLGDFWAELQGGHPSVPDNQILYLPEIVMMLYYLLTNNIILSYNLVIFTSYLLALIFSYKYGQMIIKGKIPSIYFAISYSFSAFGLNQLDHIALILSISLIPFTLFCYEKICEKNEKRYIIIGCIALFFLTTTSIIMTMFTFFFLLFRIGYKLLISKKSLKILTITTLILILYIILIIPYITPLLSIYKNIGARTPILWNSEIYAPFIRRKIQSPERWFSYISIITLSLALIPIIKNKNHHKKLEHRFFLLTSVFFFLYSLGSNSYLNIANLIHRLPFLPLVRVLSRAMLFFYLSMSVCASIGLQSVTNIEINQQKITKQTLKNKIKKIINLNTMAYAAIIFLTLDLFLPPFQITIQRTIDFENDAYSWLRHQKEEFRILELPSPWAWHLITYTYSRHDALSGTPPAYEMFLPAKKFAELYTYNLYFAKNYTFPKDFNATIHENLGPFLNESEKIDLEKRMEKLASYSAMYGVKYILLRRNIDYFKQFGMYPFEYNLKFNAMLNSTKFYTLSYEDSNFYIYQNNLFTGTTFLLVNNSFTKVASKKINPNKIEIFASLERNATLIISKSYSEKWKAEGYTIKEFEGLMAIALLPGEHAIQLIYTGYKSSLQLYGISLILLTVILFILFVLEKRLKNIFLSSKIVKISNRIYQKSRQIIRVSLSIFYITHGRKRFLMFLAVVALTFELVPYFFFSSKQTVFSQKGVYVDGKIVFQEPVFVGYKIIVSVVGELLIWSGTLILMILSSAVYLRKRREALLTTTMFGLLCSIFSSLFIYRLSDRGYVELRFGVLHSEFLVILLVSCSTFFFFIYNLFYDKITLRERPTTERFFKIHINKILKILCISTIGSTLAANLILSLRESFSFIMAEIAFYSFQIVAILYTIKHIYSLANDKIARANF